jgi:hypothetical protein
MPTLEDLRPTTDWDDLIADVRRRGTNVRRRRAITRAVAYALALAAIVAPLSQLGGHGKPGPNLEPATNPPRPAQDLRHPASAAAPALPRLHAGGTQDANASSGTNSSAAAPPAVASGPYSTQLFTDPANDVRSRQGLKRTAPQVDLRSAWFSIDGDTGTLTLTVTDLAAEAPSGYCSAYFVFLDYYGMDFLLDASRGATCKPSFSFNVSDTNTVIPVSGSFDEGANAIRISFSVAKVNEAMPARDRDTNTPVPRMGPGSEFTRAAGEGLQWLNQNQTSPVFFGSSEDPRDSYDFTGE